MHDLFMPHSGRTYHGKGAAGVRGDGAFIGIHAVGGVPVRDPVPGLIAQTDKGPAHVRAVALRAAVVLQREALVHVCAAHAVAAVAAVARARERPLGVCVHPCVCMYAKKP